MVRVFTILDISLIRKLVSHILIIFQLQGALPPDPTGGFATRYHWGGGRRPKIPNIGWRSSLTINSAPPHQQILDLLLPVAVTFWCP